MQVPAADVSIFVQTLTGSFGFMVGFFVGMNISYDQFSVDCNRVTCDFVINMHHSKHHAVTTRGDLKGFAIEVVLSAKTGPGTPLCAYIKGHQRLLLLRKHNLRSRASTIVD